MRVLTAQSAGFCRGVKLAVEKARRQAANQNRPIYTDGPLIHNRQMMDDLRRQGIIETGDPATIGDSTLLIRAHGIAPDRRRELAALPAHLVDATCPDVARIQGRIKQRAARGYHVVIFGDRGHAEVAGLLGFTRGRGHVVTEPADVADLPDMSPVCLVAQSTQFPAAYDEIAAAVRRRFPGVEVLDTICCSTRSRQDEVEQMAEQVDAFVVVGGEHSANTIRLAELAARHRPAFHIQTADQLDPAAFRDVTTVGLTAGASTPSFIIDEVRRTLEAIPGRNQGST